MDEKPPADIVDVIEHVERVWTRGYGIDYELEGPIERADRVARERRRRRKVAKGRSKKPL